MGKAMNRQSIEKQIQFLVMSLILPGAGVSVLNVTKKIPALMKLKSY